MTSDGLLGKGTEEGKEKKTTGAIKCRTQALLEIYSHNYISRSAVNKRVEKEEIFSVKRHLCWKYIKKHNIYTYMYMII